MKKNLPSKPNQVKAMLESMGPNLQKALGETIGVHRFIQLAVDTCRKNPKILQCSTISIVGCLYSGATLGLNVALGEFGIIPRNRKGQEEKEATFQLQAKGLVRMARRTGTVRAFYAMPVYPNDFFSVEYGTDKHLKHRPADIPGGDAVAFYACIEYVNGGIEFMHWGRAKMDIHRDRFSEGYKSALKYNSTDNPWIQHYDSMGCKTMLLALGKHQDLSIEFADAVASDNAGGYELSMKYDLPVPPDIEEAARREFEDAPDAVDVHSGNEATGRAVAAK